MNAIVWSLLGVAGVLSVLSLRPHEEQAEQEQRVQAESNLRVRTATATARRHARSAPPGRDRVPLRSRQRA